MYTNSSRPGSCPKPALLSKCRRNRHSTGSGHSRFSLGSVVPHSLLLTPAVWTNHHVPGIGTLMAVVLSQMEAEMQSRHPMRADVGLEEEKPKATQACTYTYPYVYIHVSTYIHMHLHTHMRTHVHTHTLTYTYKFSFTQCTSVCAHSYIHTQMCMPYIHTCTHTQIDAHICARFIYVRCLYISIVI